MALGEIGKDKVPVTRPQREFEVWLDEKAAKWQRLDDSNYKNLIKEFRELYLSDLNPKSRKKRRQGSCRNDVSIEGRCICAGRPYYPGNSQYRMFWTVCTL